MQIKLNWLEVKNFKGVRLFRFEPQGKNAFVFGANGTGKTSLVDAWQWLLFGKNAEERADFTIKPQSAFGQDIHHLQTEVEAELLVDGKPLVLRKMQEEKWTTPRGQAEATLSGNVTSYWYDEKPVKAKEFQDAIKSLIDENIFKLITNPLAFNTKLPWAERRKILLEMSGDATDEEVFSSDAKLARLQEVLGSRSIEDYKVIVNDKIKRLKKEKEGIPPRIDELTRSLPQVEPDYIAVSKEIEAKKLAMAELEEKLNSARKRGEDIAETHKAIYALKENLSVIKRNIETEANLGRQALQKTHEDLLSQQLGLKRSGAILASDRDILVADIKRGETEMTDLKKEWSKLWAEHASIMKEEFIPEEVTTHCPTCKQVLPDGDVEKQVAAMQKAFNDDKAASIVRIEESLNKNKEKGIALKASIENAKTKLAEVDTALKKSRDEYADISSRLQNVATELEKPVIEPDCMLNKEYAALHAKIIALEEAANKPVDDESAEIKQKKAILQADIDSLNITINGKDETARKKARIEELRSEESALAGQIAELEGHKFLIEQFVVAKVNLLESRINGKFSNVRFKLFEENITNEGIKETCIAQVNTNGAWVDFPDANSAGKINAGIDVINSLSSFYGVSAPIFVDNRESVTDLIPTDSQVISLVVSPSDGALRVELEVQI